MKQLILGLALLSGCDSFAQPARQAIQIYNTGEVLLGGSLAADGSVNTHYRLVSSADSSAPGPNAYVVNSNVFPIGPWMTNGPNSKWIAPAASQAVGNAPGLYTYRTTFDLTGFNPTTAVLTGAVGADNSVGIKLNGDVVIPSIIGFQTLTPFTVDVRSGKFIAGINTLDFVVTNDAKYVNPTGLRVDLSGTAVASTGTGTKGDRGDRGEKGDKGDTGPQGPQGPAGTGGGPGIATSAVSIMPGFGIVIDGEKVSIDPSTTSCLNCQQTFSGYNDFHYQLRVPSRPGVPLPAECNGESNVGKLQARTDARAPRSTLYICSQVGPGVYAWELLP